MKEVTFTKRIKIVESIYDDHETLNPKLEKIIREQGDRQNYRTALKAHMTEMNMLKEDNSEPFHELSDYIYKESLSISPAFYKPTFIDCWGGLYKVGHHAEIHDHWPALYSFVYYVNVSEECSPLVLTDCGFYYIKPKNGLLTVFPGWIKHFVPKQDSSHERIIVSGNISPKSIYEST